MNVCCFFHNAGEVSHILNVNIFAYDYTGYGMSTGEPSEEALYADIEAAFKYLRDIVGIPWRSLAFKDLLCSLGVLGDYNPVYTHYIGLI